MSKDVISAQFDDPIHDAQQAFRVLLSATSKPGTILNLPLPSVAPAPFSRGLCAIALTLFDDTTPVWLDETCAVDNVARYLRFHTGADIVGEKSRAAFAVIGDTRVLSDLLAFPGGDALYPDRSATLIVAVPSLTGGPEVTLSGPGIETTIQASPAGLPQDFWQHWADNAKRYPCGIDMILTNGTAVMGLPRTTKASF